MKTKVKDLFIYTVAICGAILLSNFVQKNGKQKKHIKDNGIQLGSNGYWTFNGKKTLLLGAFNHGHNPFIDRSAMDNILVDDIEMIDKEIQKMSEAGGNLLRCVLDPGGASFAQIYAYNKNKNGKFNLEKPDGEFFQRLEHFIKTAYEYNCVVEIEIWDRFDWCDVNWKFNPFNPKNNENYTSIDSGLDTSYARSVIYKKHPFSKSVPGHPAYDTANLHTQNQYDIIRKYQELFFSKIIRIASKYPNVLYDMNNETSEPNAWGIYWLKYARKEAAKYDKKIICTDMIDDAYYVPNSKYVLYQLEHPGLYDYMDVSQLNSRLRDSLHWGRTMWVVERAKRKNMLLNMIKIYGSDSLDHPWEKWRPGDTDNAIEEWWRNLIAGIAGVRFHRMKHGIGLSSTSIACIKATREVERQIKFWDVEPRKDLVACKDFDDVYLAINKEGEGILYFTQKGNGKSIIDLSQFDVKKIKISWININTGILSKSEVIDYVNPTLIARPDNAHHWVATFSIL